jgi:redox-sensitive bicupin YhaK (pirin superfamily)
MMRFRKSDERGHAKHGWLDSYHTFSFANYYDPEHMGFRVLRVMNEDRLSPDKGFGTHPHENMEIISYVVSGELEHKDNMGNGSVIRPGEFQIITAGTGITHSEFNPSKDEETHFYQIWILPDAKGLNPRYQQRSFPALESGQGLQLVASKTGENDSLVVNQDVRLYRSVLGQSEELVLPLTMARHGWVQLVSGALKVAGETLHVGDGAALSEVERPLVEAVDRAEFLFFDLP